MMDGKKTVGAVASGIAGSSGGSTENPNRPAD
jgi:hypothetical protein